MKFSPLKTNDNFIIEDSFIIIPRIISDERGFFFESWNQLKFDEIIGQEISFCQDNHSRSTIGVLRGMHLLDRKMLRKKGTRATTRGSTTGHSWSSL